MSQFTTPAIIEESQIAPIHAFAGKSNAAEIDLAGKKFAPGSVKFVVTAAPLNPATGLYEGVFHWEECRPGDCESADLSSVKGHEASLHGAAEKSIEVTDMSKKAWSPGKGSYDPPEKQPAATSGDAT